ncbi:hypothetical protein ACP70R_027976 [Stipagrostis hirtigluma subsp. patula]
MAGACAFAVATPTAPPPSADPGSNLAARSGFSRVSCGRNPRGRARLSRRDPGKAAPDAGLGQVLKDDSRYLWTLGLGSVGGAAVIKYGSILLPDITRPNIVQALLMVSLPVVAAVLILLRASSVED